MPFLAVLLIGLSLPPLLLCCAPASPALVRYTTSAIYVARIPKFDRLKRIRNRQAAGLRPGMRAASIRQACAGCLRLVSGHPIRL
jgi:hypothetical protein